MFECIVLQPIKSPCISYIKLEHIGVELQSGQKENANRTERTCITSISNLLCTEHMNKCERFREPISVIRNLNSTVVTDNKSLITSTSNFYHIRLRALINALAIEKRTCQFSCLDDNEPNANKEKKIIEIDDFFSPLFIS